MGKKVVCINDSHLPTGAAIAKGVEYEVEDSFLNIHGQHVYLLSNVVNTGKTKIGTMWHGYRADRFKDITKSEEKILEYEYALN